MRNWIATQVLKHLYKGYLITATFPYSAHHNVTLTIDLGRLVCGLPDSCEYEVTETSSGGYVN